MSSSYRINVRFDTENPEEAAVLTQLREMQNESRCSLSRLIISVLKEHLTDPAGFPFSLDDIRLVFREELDAASLMPAAVPALLSTKEIVLSEEEQEENAQSVLKDLEMFG